MTLIQGDGIGPEISQAVVKIFEAAKVSPFYKIINVGAFYFCILLNDRPP